MKKLIYALFLIAFTAISNKGFSEEDVFWIKNCQDNRVYINTECLIISENGMALVDEFNKTTPISELYSDSKGIYTRAESLGTELTTVWNIVWCRNCEAYRSITRQGKCNICGLVP